MSLPTDFRSLFELASGYSPYEYQVALAADERPPDILRIPTGSGKTQALLVAWMHQRITGGRGPRRLVYALPMRSLVEQTATVARQLRSRVGLAESELPIHVLMGGEEQDEVSRGTENCTTFGHRKVHHLGSWFRRSGGVA